jgi:hypothetical protein
MIIGKPDAGKPHVRFDEGEGHVLHGLLAFCQPPERADTMEVSDLNKACSLSTLQRAAISLMNKFKKIYRWEKFIFWVMNAFTLCFY